MLKKIILTILVLTSIVLASVSINSPNPYSTCNTTACEPISLNIKNSGGGLSEQVYLIIKYADGDGKIIYAENFLKHGKNEFLLNAPFDLPVGNREYVIRFFGIGQGKFNISVIGADTSTEYARLDPWWRNEWLYRQPVNITYNENINDTSFYLTFQNISGLKTSGKLNINCNDIRLVKGEGLNENELPYWFSPLECEYSNDLRIYTRGNLTNGTETYFVYYGNANATDGRQGVKVFEAFDDFDDVILNTSKWKSKSSYYTIANGEIQFEGSEVGSLLLSKEFNTTNKTWYELGTNLYYQRVTSGRPTYVGFTINNQEDMQDLDRYEKGNYLFKYDYRQSLTYYHEHSLFKVTSNSNIGNRADNDLILLDDDAIYTFINDYSDFYTTIYKDNVENVTIFDYVDYNGTSNYTNILSGGNIDMYENGSVGLAKNYYTQTNISWLWMREIKVNQSNLISNQGIEEGLHDETPPIITLIEPHNNAVIEMPEDWFKNETRSNFSFYLQEDESNVNYCWLFLNDTESAVINNAAETSVNTFYNVIVPANTLINWQVKCQSAGGDGYSQTWHVTFLTNMSYISANETPNIDWDKWSYKECVNSNLLRVKYWVDKKEHTVEYYCENGCVQIAEGRAECNKSEWQKWLIIVGFSLGSIIVIKKLI